MKQLSTIALLAFLGLSINGNAQNLNFLWAKQMSGATTDEGYSIAVDANGNVYTTGAFTGTADFNPSTDPNTGTYNLTAVGNYDIFVSKLDASGNFVWAKQFGGHLLTMATLSLLMPMETFIQQGTFRVQLTLTQVPELII